MAHFEPGALHKRIPKIKKGTVIITHDSPDPLTRLRAERDGQPLHAEKYTRLFINNQLWMTDADFDCWTNERVVRQLAGDVLIAGLGLGMILPPILSSNEVKSATVLEISQDLIDAVSPLYKSKKLKIIQADCKEWLVPKKSYDSIYIDIWPNVPNSDDWEEMKSLKRKYRSGLRPGGKVWAWCEDYAKRDIRKSKQGYRF